MKQIADQKRRSNAVEYLLYLWQMEDLLRAHRLDVSALSAAVLQGLSPEIREANERWFSRMAAELRRQEKPRRLEEASNLLHSLESLEAHLQSAGSNPTFSRARAAAMPYLDEFRLKTRDSGHGHVALALTLLYGVLALRLKGEPVRPPTAEASQAVSHYLRALAAAYHKASSKA